MVKTRTKIVVAAGLILVAAELILRVAGFSLRVPVYLKNRVREDDAKKIRILTLGESTTTDWPGRLEEGLNRAGVRSRVYNEGRGGTTSPFILASARELIKYYRPHIVISMMGVNDLGALVSEESGVAGFASNLRLVKVFRWVRLALEARSACKIRSHLLDVRRFGPLIREVLGDSKMDAAKVEARLRQQVSDDHEVAQLLVHLGVKIRGRPGSPASAFFQRAWELFPLDQDAVFWALVDSSPDRCKAIGQEIWKCGPNIPDVVLARLAVCYPEEELSRSSALASRGILLARHRVNVTATHYRALHRILEETHIEHIAMQYPTLPVDDLKGYFVGEDGRMEKEFEDIHFVSNEENFKKLLSEHPYEAVFTDRFRSTWGHPTPLGYQSIADRLLPIVLEVVARKPPGL